MNDKTKMDEILGVMPTIEQEVKVTKENIDQLNLTATYNANGDLEEDYTKARETMQGLLTTGNQALEKVLALSIEASDSPRAFEVTANLISTVSKVAKDLMELQKTMKDLTAPINGDNNPIGEEDNLIYEDSTDLLDELEDEKD